MSFCLAQVQPYPSCLSPDCASAEGVRGWGEREEGKGVREGRE